MLGQILFLAFIGSIASLVGGVLLALRRKALTHPQSLLLISFAAGVLLATALLDLLPEALAILPDRPAGGQVWGWVLAGVVFLFLLEKLLIWYHHHDQEHSEHGFTPLMITVGDTLHNFVDGVVIAAAVLASPTAGMVTALAVAAHEVPHELADFAVLLAKGWSRKKVVLVNLASAAMALVGAGMMYGLGNWVEGILPQVLALSVGMFIYLACSDLIPELHHEHGHRDIGHNVLQVLVFALGIVVVWGLIKLLEG